MKEDIWSLKERANTQEQSLEVLTQIVQSVAVNQQKLSGNLITLFDTVNKLTDDVQKLDERQKRTDEHFERLAEVQFRSDERIERLAEAQSRTEDQLTNLSATVDQLSQTVDRYLSARLNSNSQN
ncbi:MAG: hypothetical protein M3X11_09095 [Acidobacteriota bacterium]|nr:hypothetical protein [Acidobacteriota bacterium]